ncbi:MAG: RNA polymerase sigma factor region1.1 domain-containing protein, partial [Oscillospiraceae bacterium]|nr:RNA polymerase sigma factor region1.1 domain-containing protein [Oscillospiraceae bacterium]
MDKKTAINHLIEKGKAAGKLSTQDIDSLIIEYDFEIDELDKLYELIEQNGIEVADDMSETAIDALSFDSD